jgi:polyisoprenoid-binding protein YceI
MKAACPRDRPFRIIGPPIPAANQDTSMLLSLAHLIVLAGSPATALSLAPETYDIDWVHSTVVFKVKHLDVSYFRGRFNQIEGSIVYDRGDATKCQVELVVTAESVDTNAPGRDRHLKSPDFLDVNQFPAIEFKSTKVKAGEKGALEITGDLKLHGVTKSITVTATKVGEASGPRGEKLIGFDTVFTIKRSEFGMTYSLDQLGDEVEIAVGLEAKLR